MKRIRRSAVVGALCALIAVGLTLAGNGPGVPLAAVEANTAPASLSKTFSDPPTPFPVPRPPFPRPVPDGFTTELAMTKIAKGRTWFTRLPDDRLRFHSCLDAIAYRLEDESTQVREFVIGLAQSSATQIDAALMPWEEDLRSSVHEVERLTHARVPIEEINRLWLSVVAAHAEEIAVAIPETAPMVDAGTCTEGPCYCTSCPKGKICDCQLYIPGEDDCRVIVRENCNVVDDPPTPKASREISWSN